jgi:hypothetical protein
MKELLTFAVGLIAMVAGVVFALLGRYWMDETLANWGWTLITFMLGAVFGVGVTLAVPKVVAIIKREFRL